MKLLRTEKQKRVAGWIHWGLTTVVTILLLSSGQFKEHAGLLVFGTGCVNLLLLALGRILPNSEQTNGEG
ncbi:MAG: hypothetical protein KAS32_19650 [Candidatus Peribacteraceae bacterium]|nr:hypothetical protein [Candidatus Peribacteraceae bacterium]